MEQARVPQGPGQGRGSADVCLPSGVCVSSWPWFPVPRALLRSARPRTNPAFTLCLSLSEVPGARGRAEPLFILFLKPLLPPPLPPSLRVVHSPWFR